MQNENKNEQINATDSDCLSASELVQRHLKDKEHQISDEDLKKVALDCNEPLEENQLEVTMPDATSTALNLKAENSDTDNDGDKDDDDKEEKDILRTPLDILS